MATWQNYLQSLCYSPAIVECLEFGTEFGNILDMQEDTVFLKPLSRYLQKGDIFKIQFVNSKLGNVSFVTQTVRVSKNLIMAKLIEYEINYNRHPLADLQYYWENPDLELVQLK